METPPKKVIIYPTSYIKSLMYFQRFTNEYQDPSEFQFALGVFIGYVEKEMVITDFIPIKDFSQEYIRFKDYSQIFQIIETINKEYYDEEYPEYVLGWARNSVYGALEPTLIDKENHFLFQTSIHPKGFLWVFDYEDLSIGYGFTLYRFKEDFLSINLTSPLEEIPSKFAKDILLDELIKLAIEIEEKRKIKKPLLKGREET